MMMMAMNRVQKEHKNTRKYEGKKKGIKKMYDEKSLRFYLGFGCCWCC